MAKKVIIIGAGISGLTAGIYACKAGFDVEIYESHSVAGGECTGWKRNDFDIDGCIHWMTGTLKETDLYKVWETCDALNNEVEVVNHEYLSAYLHKDKLYYLYSDLNKLQQELIRIAPNDSKAIKKFTKAVKICQRIEIPVNKPYEFISFPEKIKLLFKFFKIARCVNKASRHSAKEYIADISSPIVKKMIQTVLPDHIAASSLIAALGFRTKGDGGWPMGGSYEMVQRMQKKFESLGGHIHLGVGIDEIVIENGKAIGVRTKKANEIERADYIVPAIDAYTLLNKLLGGIYKDNYFDKRFDNPPGYLLASSTIIALGVRISMGNRPHNLYINLDTPLRINKATHTNMIIRHYDYDPKFCSNEKSLIEVVLPDFEFDYWNELKKTSTELYKNEKARILNAIVAEIQKVYPEITDKVKMTDIATPTTFKRYCSAYKGSYMSFITIPKAKPSMIPDNHKGTIDGIQNMYLASQWVFPNGGLPMAAIAGKFAIQRICKQERLSIVL
ncbi:MAG: NAD(P)/FAD-dependent oxidoreductase [Prevotellaceae bacterium]|jgi:phytoene dehydrogenase-like protein|nr:NAD(P)/FAD-dependent oxidoreductase [Prevotellaceae bacterium]